MIFVDTNVVMYAVGKPHPLKARARDFFDDSLLNLTPLCTSAEVLQELVHAYLPVGKHDVLEDALDLLDKAGVEVWPLDREDVLAAVRLSERHPELSERDLYHLASCHRRGVREIMTFDEALGAASQHPHRAG